MTYSELGYPKDIISVADYLPPYPVALVFELSVPSPATLCVRLHFCKQHRPWNQPWRASQ